MSKKNKKIFTIGIYVLIFLIVLLLCYYYFINKNNNDLVVVQNESNISVVDNSFDTYQDKQILGKEGLKLLEAAQKAYKEEKMDYTAVCISSKYLTNKGYYDNKDYEGSILITYNDSNKETDRFWITNKEYIFINANPTSYLYSDALTYTNDLSNMYKECNNEDITSNTIVKCDIDSCN